MSNRITKFQQGIVAGQSINVESSLFNIGGYLEIPTVFPKSKYFDVMNSLVSEIPDLKTKISVKGEPEQYIDQSLQNEEINKVVTVPSRADAISLIDREMGTPFKLDGTEPLCQQIAVLAEDGWSFVFLKIHHSISDGYSAYLYSNRLADKLSAVVSGEVIPSFTPYQWMTPYVADSELKHLNSEESESQAQFWRTQISNYSETRGFESLFNQSPAPTMRCERYEFEIPREVFNDITQLAKSEGCSTVFPALLANLAVLNEVTGNEPFLIGVSTMQRKEETLRNAFGPFLNALPFALEVGQHETYRDLIRSLNNQRKEIYKNRDIPLYTMKEDSGVSGSIYNVGFSYQPFPFDKKVEGLETSFTFLPAKEQQEDLVIHIIDWNGFEDDPKLLIDARVDVIRQEQINYLGERFVDLLRDFSTNPDILTKDIEPCRADIRQGYLEQLNRTKSYLNGYGSVFELIDEQTAKNPNQVAVKDVSTELTYSELRQQSVTAAYRLLDLSEKGQIGLYMTRSRFMTVAIHGIGRSGKAYVPIAPDFPDERINHIINNSELDLIITDDDKAEGLKKSFPNVNCFPISELINMSYTSPEKDLPLTQGDSWAYIIYTSGSTGMPKGVPNYHSSLLNRIGWQQKTIPLEGSDIVMQKTPYTFDVSVWEFFWPFMYGAKQFLLPPDLHKDPIKMGEFINTYEISVLHFVPSMLQVFLTYAAKENLESLKHVICSGEELMRETVDEFYSKFSNTTLYNLYGPTEACIDVTFWTCTRESDLSYVPIGYPVDNTFILVLNKYNKILPQGIAGELCIGGYNLSYGYINNSDLTDKKFLNLEFDSNLYRIYKSGDLARWANQEHIEYLGRIDNQVKLNGQRVDLLEIDSQIYANEFIDDVKTIVKETNENLKQVVAFCVASKNEEDHGFLSQSIRENLEKIMPSFMIPGIILFLDEIPLSPNGKKDIKALQKIPLPCEADRYAVRPETVEERNLLDLFQSFLKTSNFGVTDDFFKAGGTSLDAIKLVSEYGECSISDLYENPTVRSLIGAEPISKEPLVLLSDTNSPKSNTDLICVPFGGGNPYIYSALASLTNNRVFSVYPIRDKKLSIQDEAADIVASYRARVDDYQRVDVYGHCVGSALAFEITRQLEESGIEVSNFYSGGYIAKTPYWMEKITDLIQGWIYRRESRVVRFMQKIGFNEINDLTNELQSEVISAFVQDGLRARKYFNTMNNTLVKARGHVILGSNDPLTRIPRLFSGWSSLFDGGLITHEIHDADHYFVQNRTEDVAEILYGYHDENVDFQYQLV